ncbi:unnamed protein product [Linum tenue]|uniref:Uncharacterized protein n=1 Tax=Linum tenue TaxID=586396 RepID=A0AAV0MD35_9ROSI|nr:unnamed protein product [Linum tenue]
MVIFCDTLAFYISTTAESHHIKPWTHQHAKKEEGVEIFLQLLVLGQSPIILEAITYVPFSSPSTI